MILHAWSPPPAPWLVWSLQGRDFCVLVELGISKWWIFAGWEWCHWKENRRYEAKCIFDDHIVHVVYILTSYWGCPSNSDRALSQVATFQNWNKFMSEEFWIQQSPNSFGLCARKNPPKDSALDFVLSKDPGDNERLHGIVCGIIDSLIMWPNLLKSYKYSIIMYNRVYKFAHSKSTLLVLA